MKTYLNALAAILALALTGAGAYGVWSYRSMATLAAEVGPLRAQLVALEDQHQALAKEVVSRAEIDKAIREARLTITTKLDEAVREDPVTRDYLGERIPDRVRSAYGSRPPER